MGEFTDCSGEAPCRQRSEEEVLAFGLKVESLFKDAFDRKRIDHPKVESTLTGGLQPFWSVLFSEPTKQHVGLSKLPPGERWGE
jgi:hypothetical protein